MSIILQLKLPEEALIEIAKAVFAQGREGRPETYTVKDTAKRLRISPQTVRRRIKAGLIPAIPGLGTTRIPGAWVDRQVDLDPNA